MSCLSASLAVRSFKICLPSISVGGFLEGMHTFPYKLEDFGDMQGPCYGKHEAVDAYQQFNRLVVPPKPMTERTSYILALFCSDDLGALDGRCTEGRRSNFVPSYGRTRPHQIPRWEICRRTARSVTSLPSRSACPLHPAFRIGHIS